VWDEKLGAVGLSRGKQIRERWGWHGPETKTVDDLDTHQKENKNNEPVGGCEIQGTDRRVEKANGPSRDRKLLSKPLRRTMGGEHRTPSGNTVETMKGKPKS